MLQKKAHKALTEDNSKLYREQLQASVLESQLNEVTQQNHTLIDHARNDRLFYCMVINDLQKPLESTIDQLLCITNHLQKHLVKNEQIVEQTNEFGQKYESIIHKTRELLNYNNEEEHKEHHRYVHKAEN